MRKVREVQIALTDSKSDDRDAILADRDAYPFPEDPYTCPMYDDTTFVALVEQEAPEMKTRGQHQQFLAWHTNKRDIAMMPLQDFEGGAHGPIRQGLIYFNNWDTKLCYAIWKHSTRLWIRTFDASQGGKRFPSEKQFVAALVHHLSQQGWQCAQEVSASPGRIDVVATRQGDIRVIEAKLSTNLSSVSQALGQLLLRKQAYPNASLWLASPERPSEFLLQMLEAQGVSYLGLT
jgi:Holliday junction resolvase-like predicted endonuclease